MRRQPRPRKVGWDDNGVLVLNQQINGGKTDKVSDDAAKSLHKAGRNRVQEVRQEPLSTAVRP